MKTRTRFEAMLKAAGAPLAEPPGWEKCSACNGTGKEFPGNPRTEKCEECDGTGKVRV